MTINKKIIGGYVIILALLVIATSVAFYTINQTQSTYDRFLNMDERLLESANELRAVTYAQQTYVRGILLFPELLNQNQSLLQANDRQFKQIFERMRRLIEVGEGLELVNDLMALQQQLEQTQQSAIQLTIEKKIKKH